MDELRLIDANKAFVRYQRKLARLIDEGEDRFSDECMKIRAIMSAIENEPTAYDIDKVIRKLKETANIPVTEDEECWLLLDETIEIVKEVSK